MSIPKPVYLWKCVFIYHLKGIVTLSGTNIINQMKSCKHDAIEEVRVICELVTRDPSLIRHWPWDRLSEPTTRHPPPRPRLLLEPRTGPSGSLVASD